MKWVAVFLIVVVTAVACGDVVDSGNDLEARVEAIEEALAPTSPPWEPQREGLIDVSDLEWRVDSLEDSVFSLEMGWR